MEGHRPAEGDRLALHPRRALADLTPELAEQAGLPDARLPHDGHDLSLTRLGLTEPLPEQPELGLAADEPAASPRSGPAAPTSR